MAAKVPAAWSAPSTCCSATSRTRSRPTTRRPPATAWCEIAQDDRLRRHPAVDPGQLPRLARGASTTSTTAGHRDRRQARRDHGPEGRRAPRTSTTSTGCSPSSRPRPASTGRSWCTRSSRRPAAWPTSRRSAAPRPRMQGLSLGPADLAADRRMKTTRVGGGHPGYLVRQDPDLDRTTSRPPPRDLPAGPVALHDRPHGRRLRDARDLPVLRPVRRHRGHGRLRGPVPQRLPARLRRRLEPAPGADRRSPSGCSRPSADRRRATPGGWSPRWATAPAR